MINQEFCEKAKEAFTYIYILICSLIMSLFATSSPVFSTYIDDSAVFVYVAKVILGGNMPYKDTFDHKGPLIYLIDALGLLIDEKTGIWLMEILTIFIICLFAYKIVRLLHCGYYLSYLIIFIGIFVLLFYFQGGNLTEEYACAFITVSLYYFLQFFISKNFPLQNLILCGLSFAAVCMLRANMIAMWIVMFIGVFVEWFKDRKNIKSLQMATWFMFGVILLIVPIVIWLLKNGAFTAFIDDYIIFNVLYSSDPKTASIYNICEAIKFFVLNPMVLVSIITLLYSCIKQNLLADKLCLCGLLLSIVMACMSGRKYVHYGMIFYPFIIYSFARFFSNFMQRFNKPVAGQYIKVSVVLICLLAQTCNLFIEKKIFWDNVMGQEKQIAKCVLSITSESDNVSVCGNDNTVYLLSNRKSASKYSYQFPVANINPKVWQEYFNDIKNLTAKVIVVLPDFCKMFPYSQIKSVLDEHYSLAGTVGKTEIYLLK